MKQDLMEPNTSQNLERFLKSYEKHQKYGLTYAPYKGNMTELELQWNSIILKHRLIVRNAWEIFPNEFESAGINLKDDIIIPENINNPPVFKLLEWLKTKQK